VEYGPERAQRYLNEVVDRLEAYPGVESVSMVGTGTALGAAFTAEVSALGSGADGAAESGEASGGRESLGDASQGAASLTATYLEVGPLYFETLGTPVLRGREISRRDRVGSPPVAVVSEALANVVWPQGDAVGSFVKVDGVRHTVVGLVADVPLQARAEPPRPTVFVPFWQNPEQVDARLQVRVSGDPAAMLPQLAREVLGVNPDVPVTEMLTLEERMAGRFRGLRMSAMVVSYAAALAVILSAVGLYASLASAVTRRTREIGIRQALGAQANGILRMIAREGMTVVVAGVGVGLGLGLASTRLLQHVLYGSAEGDAFWHLVAAVVVACTGLLACWVPARRAARIAPMEALRHE
jgi:putative ABC transport system permease protein